MMEEIKGARDAVRRYFQNYMMDEAMDEGNAGCGYEQHVAAVAVGDALATLDRIIAELESPLREIEPLSFLDTPECLDAAKRAIGAAFVPDGIWNIEEGWKMERAAKAAIAAIKAMRKEVAP